MKLSDAEWVVMNAVWDRAPVTVRDVLDVVGGETDWAYTTVKTILTRLVEKGVLKIRKRANTSVFEPQISRAQARHSAVSALLARAFDGTFGSLMQHMISQERLSGAEQKKLAAMLSELETPQGRKK